MKKYRGGESVQRGAYLNLTTWEVVQLRGGAPILPGGGEVQYLKAPAPLVAVLGPLAGLAFIMFLPFIGIIGIAGFLAYKVGRGARVLSRRTIQPAAIEWEPGMAYLTRRARKPKKEQPAEGVDGKLTELEQEVARRRQQEKE